MQCTPLGAAPTQQMWKLLAGKRTSVLPWNALERRISISANLCANKFNKTNLGASGRTVVRFLACVAGAKRGGGGGGERERGKSPSPFPLPPYPLPPTPFDACYAGYAVFSQQQTTRKFSSLGERSEPRVLEQRSCRISSRVPLTISPKWTASLQASQQLPNVLC